MDLGEDPNGIILFTKAILEGKSIDIFNNDNMQRDFTYVDDIIEGIVRVIDNLPTSNLVWTDKKSDPSCSVAPYKIYNIGNSSPVKLMDFIEATEEAIGQTAKKNFLPLQSGDVPVTWADVEDLVNNLDYKPSTKVNEGIKKFVDWYKNYYC